MVHESEMRIAASPQDSSVTLTLPSLSADTPRDLAAVASFEDERAIPERTAEARASRPAPSFRAIFDAHYDYVWLSLRRLGVSDRDREDITNEVFFRVHGRLDAYDPERPIRPWLFAFAVRAASDYRKLARHRREASVPEGTPISVHPGPGPDEHAIRREEQQLVALALDALDMDRRSVFVMHELDQVAVPTIASALGIPLGTAYTRLRSARQDFAIAVRRLSARRVEAP